MLENNDYYLLLFIIFILLPKREHNRKVKVVVKRSADVTSGTHRLSYLPSAYGHFVRNTKYVDVGGSFIAIGDRSQIFGGATSEGCYRIPCTRSDNCISKIHYITRSNTSLM